MRTPTPVPDAPPTERPIWGIDVSKTRLDIVSWPTMRHWQVANDATGWATLVTEATGANPAHVVLEATGAYEVGVVVALDAAGWTPAVLNPLTVRRYAQSHAHLAKTDRIDAAVLAQFGAERRPVPRAIPSELARDLAALLAERAALTAQLIAVRNRRQQARPCRWERLAAHEAWLDAQRTQLDADLAALVASDPAWQARIDLLTTVPGIGVLTATILAVQLPELGRISGRQAAALVGVAPVAHDSGQLRKPRRIRGGRRTVRQARYQAMLTAKRWNPVIRAHHAALLARGKPPKVATIACVRKLLGLLTAMLREGCSWHQLRAAQPAPMAVAA